MKRTGLLAFAGLAISTAVVAVEVSGGECDGLEAEYVLSGTLEASLFSTAAGDPRRASVPTETVT